jgi:hypothetical protein
MNSRRHHNSTTRSPGIVAALLLACGIAACDGSATGSSVDPGVEIRTNGVAIGIGAPRAQVVSQLGQPASAHDLGIAGVLLSFPDRHLSCLVSGPADTATVTAIYLSAGFEGLTPDGIGLGSTRAVVAARYPSAAIDPFLGTWRDASGIAFDWDGDTVASITVSLPGN